MKKKTNDNSKNIADKSTICELKKKLNKRQSVASFISNSFSGQRNNPHKQ